MQVVLIGINPVLQWNLSNPDTLGTRLKCPDDGGVLISQVHIAYLKGLVGWRFTACTIFVVLQTTPDEFLNF